jgi:hypothetical protein
LGQGFQHRGPLVDSPSAEALIAIPIDTAWVGLIRVESLIGRNEFSRLVGFAAIESSLELDFEELGLAAVFARPLSKDASKHTHHMQEPG